MTWKKNLLREVPLENKLHIDSILHKCMSKNLSAVKFLSALQGILSFKKIKKNDTESACIRNTNMIRIRGLICRVYDFFYFKKCLMGGKSNLS